MSLADRYGISLYRGGTNITNHTISYTWSKKVCTGIGTMTLIIENSIIDTINISDSIEIFENSALVFTGYVSKTTDNYQGTSTIECQDKSKNLVDYFITETYLIDYASFSRTWIEKFLTDAQVSYQFLTEENGSLLSNNTSLGLTSAYDQIMSLLQQNGWYIEFTPGGGALIGKLTSSVSNGVSINKSRILQIEVIKDDKMLRNRGVVWGNANPNTGLQVYADVYRPTPWDIDSNDKRAFVVANSNIPNSYTANQIANAGLDTFAKITEEKHIVVESLLGVGFSTRIYVDSDVFNGSGIVTTYGTSCDSNGLKTNIILDERCPRLFGSFYDFGDFVYVGTDGSGVWRKQLESGIWYNFSGEINDLHISDLYKNKDLISCVTASGEAYRTYGGYSSWIPIEIPPLTINENDIEASGMLALNLVSSGLMTRACIMDKTSNDIRLLVDNREGANYPVGSGINISSMLAATSGVGSRAWVLDYSSNGVLIEQYPIHISGDYDSFIFAGGDIENDGSNDFVSVLMAEKAFHRTPQGRFDLGYASGHPGGVTTVKSSISDTFEYPTQYANEYFTSYQGYTFLNYSLSVFATENEYQVNYSWLGNSKTNCTINKLINSNTWNGRSHAFSGTYAVIGSFTNGDVTRFFSNSANHTYFEHTYSTNSWSHADLGTTNYCSATVKINNKIYFSRYENITNDDGPPWFYIGFNYWVYELDMETSSLSEYSSGGIEGSLAHRSVICDLVIAQVNNSLKIICPYVQLDLVNGNDSYVYLNDFITGDGEYLGIWEDAQWYYSGSYGDVDVISPVNNANFYGVGSLNTSPTNYFSIDSGGIGPVSETYTEFPILDSHFTNSDVYSSGIKKGTNDLYITDSVGNPLIKVDFGAEYTPRSMSGVLDYLDGSFYVLANKGSETWLIKTPNGTDITNKIKLSNSTVPDVDAVVDLYGPYIVITDPENNSVFSIFAINDSTVDEIYITYAKVLRRVNDIYNEIISSRAGTYYKLEISQNNPVLIYSSHVSSNIASLKMYISGPDIFITTLTTPNIHALHDVRYTCTQDDYLAETEVSLFYASSGMMIRSDISSIYVSGYDTNFLDTYDEYLIMSGIKFLETTNYKYPYQYIFAATSGMYPTFMQQNNTELGFIDYSSGLPESSITIIRIDDSI